MEIPQLYDTIIDQLKKNQRPKVGLSKELTQKIQLAWRESLNSPRPDVVILEKIFCILDNTHNTSMHFNDLFELSFTRLAGSGDLLIFMLAASRKHIVEESLKTGTMIPQFYFEELKKLLQHKNPEVLEWTLRTIEAIGPLSLRLKDEIRQSKPGYLKLLNRHHKAAFEIIELLEKQWKNKL